MTLIFEGRGDYAQFTATAFEMTVGGLSLPFTSNQFVPMVTEHAGLKKTHKKNMNLKRTHFFRYVPFTVQAIPRCCIMKCTVAFGK